MVKTKRRRNKKGRVNFTMKLSTLFNPIGTIIMLIAFQNLDKKNKKNNKELNKKLKEIENDFNRIPCKSLKKKYRKECYTRKKKKKLQKQ